MRSGQHVVLACKLCESVGGLKTCCERDFSRPRRTHSAPRWRGRIASADAHQIEVVEHIGKPEIEEDAFREPSSCSKVRDRVRRRRSGIRRVQIAGSDEPQTALNLPVTQEVVRHPQIGGLLRNIGWRVSGPRNSDSIQHLAEVVELRVQECGVRIYTEAGHRNESRCYFDAA